MIDAGAGLPPRFAPARIRSQKPRRCDGRRKGEQAQTRLCPRYDLLTRGDQLRTVMQEMSECFSVLHTASA
jgi:hypothetical protein